jgi:hypothetical protein
MNFKGTAIGNATVQIRRKNESTWLTLGSPANLNPWTAKIAGIFEMRGIGTVDGQSVETPIAEVEVRFPEYSDITGDTAHLLDSIKLLSCSRSFKKGCFLPQRSRNCRCCLRLHWNAVCRRRNKSALQWTSNR